MQLSRDTFDNADVERDSRERMIILRGQHLPPCRPRAHSKEGCSKIESGCSTISVGESPHRGSAFQVKELGAGPASAHEVLGGAWLIEDGIPSRAEQKEQLKLMKRRNQLGDEQSVTSR